jgi:hypothetical protein
MVPKQVVLLLCGIPATRKSTFGRYLARKHGFAHYDLECYPRGWPIPELKETWDTDRTAFVAQLRRHHDRVALDWGFSPSCSPWVEQLMDQGVKLIWLDGDVFRAREEFQKRGGIDMTHFDRQVEAIKRAGYPHTLNCIVVPALSSSGDFLDPIQVERMIFP